MSNAVRPHRRQPRLRRPWDSPGKNAGVGRHFLLQCMKVKSFSHVRLFATPWTAAYQAPLPMGFSRQEYWSGLPLPSPLLSILIIILTHLCSSIYYSFLFIAESTPLQKKYHYYVIGIKGNDFFWWKFGLLPILVYYK